MVDQNKGKGVMGGDSQDIGSERKFQCEFCRQQFYSPQSLGGHQNAHKKERAASKKPKQAAELLAIAPPPLPLPPPPPPPPPPHLYPFVFNPQPYAIHNHFQPSYNINIQSSHNSHRYHPYAGFYGDSYRTPNNGSTVGGNRLRDDNMPMVRERNNMSKEGSSSKARKWISMMAPKEASSEFDVRQVLNMSRIVDKEIVESKLDLSLHL